MHRDTSLDLTTRHIDFRLQTPLSFALPSDVVIKATKQALTLANKHCATHPAGVSDLRAAIAQWLYMEKSMPVQADQVGMVGSKAMALWLCAKPLVADGGYVVLGEHHTELARQTLQAAGIPMLTVKTNAQGVDLDDLERLCINYHVRALYLPSTMWRWAVAALHQQALLSLAQRANFMVIEEDSPLELPPCLGKHPPLNAHDSARIIYINAFSDWVLPHVSLAYVVANAPFIASLTQTYQTTCKQSTLINELTILTLIQTGALKRHMKRLGRQYQQKQKWFSQRVATTLTHVGKAAEASTGLVNLQATEFGIAEFGIKIALSFPSTMPFSPVYASNAAFIEAFMQEAHDQQLALTAPEPNLQQVGTYSLSLHFLHLSDQEITEGILRLTRLMDGLALTLVVT
jgi:DNA-binding transcriptional MocR family regulator